ncbi:uncharacterized protein LOC122723833 isoform X2 [Manihot esculenta]|uniref:uncharacterized protein LOC122723833 isoform X2 n=1 Tax=Manihot esculenta TaxID=3983 RepID=UPI001CC5E95D|nr:uncharacterized protein LOC122723833 isoform X2 [Manihot esculenta]
MKKYIASFDGIWKERGVTIMCDGWSGPTRMSIVNFLVYSNRGTMFYKSINASDVEHKDGEYYFKIMKEVVEEIGPQKVVQVVTDNEAAIKLGGKKLMEKFPNLYLTVCSAHCIDLILEDIGKKKSVKKIIVQAKVITQFIYNHNWVVNYMKKFTDNRDIIRPGITRFATNFIALESIVRYRVGLGHMFESEQWMMSKYGQTTSGPAHEAKKIVLGLGSEGRNFWERAQQIMKVQEPLLKVLRLVDGDDKPTMGFIYEAMERAKFAIQKNSRSYLEYWRIIDHRWNFQLHHDLHAAGYFLNPQYQYDPHDIGNDNEIMLGLKNVIQHLEGDLVNQGKALNQALLFRDKIESFETVLAQKAIKFTNPCTKFIK